MSVSDLTVTTPGSETVLSVRDLKVWYGTARGAVRAVDGVSFDLRRGETLGLVGESGSGKSTLGRGVLGLLPDAAKITGEVRFRDRDLVTMRKRDLRSLRGPELGLIFQEPMTRLNPLMRISDHFFETLHTHERGLSKEQMRRRALDTLGAPADRTAPPPGCRFRPPCPDAMRVCPLRRPPTVTTELNQNVDCWLHGPDELIPDGGREPLQREAIGVADEA